MKALTIFALLIPCALASAASAASAASGESRIKLKPGAERQRVEEKCVLCHSLDYITMNAPVFDRKGWEAEVLKMRKVMGAPLTDDDIAPIVDYLAKNYAKRWK